MQSTSSCYSTGVKTQRSLGARQQTAWQSRLGGNWPTGGPAEMLGRDADVVGPVLAAF